MKKITLMFFMSLVSLCAFAQLPEGFEGTFPPPGWGIYDNGIGTNYSWTQANGGPLPAHTGDHAAYMREENVLAGLAEDWLTTPLVEVPADPQLIFWSRMTQNNNQGAMFEVRLSTDPDQSNLASYTEVLGSWTETELNPIQQAYVEVTVDIPAAYVGQDVFIAFVRIGDEGDRWLIDDVNLVSECLAPTDLTASNFGLTSATLSWANPGGASEWEIEIVDALGVPSGTATHTHTGGPSVDITTGLTEDSDYKYYIRAICADGNSSDWVGPFNFSTVATGATCEAPIVITTANYFTTDNTDGFGDDYSGSPGATGCGTTNAYLNGDDVVYEYTATATGVISINMSGTGAAAGLFVYDDCDDIGVSCVAGGTGNATTPVNIPSFAVTEDETYYIVISTWADPQTTPYTLTIQQVFCAPPVGNPATNIDNDSADLSWTNPSSATSWEVVVQEAGTGLPTGAGVTVNTTPAYTATGLDEATNYEFYVRAACGDGNFSAWAGPYNFMTTQVPAAMDYSQDFEGASHGWSLSNGTQPNKWFVGTAVNNGGANALYVSNDNGATNNYNTGAASVVHAYRDIQMPAVVDQVSLSFDWKNVGENGWDYLRVWIVPATFVPVTGTQITAAASGGVQVGGNFSGNPAWTTQTSIINASEFAGTVARLVFEWRNDGIFGAQPPAAVDNINFELVTCSSPSDLAISDLEQDEVTFTWTSPTAGNPTFDYVFLDTNTAPTDTTVPTGNVDAEAVTIGGLDPSTTYYFWVRSNCGPDNESFWVGPLSFTTPQIPADLDYSQDFEGATHEWTLNNGTQTNKWHVGTATGNPGKSLYVSNDAGVSNTYTVTSTSVVQAYRDIQLPDAVDQLSLSFDWKNFGESGFDYLRVWVVPVTFTPTPGVQTSAANSGGIQVGGNFQANNTWTTVNTTINAAPFAGEIVRLIFEWRNDGIIGTQPPAAVDNINVEVITCPSPSGLEVSGVTTTEATVTWTGPTSVSPTFDYYVSTENVAPGDTDVTGNVAGETVDLEGLPDSTQHFVWVRSNCGPGDTSFWIGPIAFNTLCTAFDVPFFEGFNTDSESEFCWTVLNENGDADTWNMNGFNPFEGDQSASINTDFNNGNNDDWLISPTINLTGNERLKFHFRVNSSFEPNDFEVLLSTSGMDPDDFTIELVPLASYSNTGYVEVIVNLLDGATPISGPVNIAWHVPGGGLDGWILFIDNVIVEPIPSCPDPTNLAMGDITSTTAEVLWTPGFMETAWHVVVQPVGTGEPTEDSIIIDADSTPFTITGLTPGTQYEYYVRANCAEDDYSNWIGPVPFNTAVCEVEDQCLYSFVMTDLAFGWEGNTMTISQNGIPVATIGSTFTSGTGPVIVQVPLCDGVPFELFWNTGGSFIGEVGVSIVDPFDNVLYTKPPGTGSPNTVLYASTASCTPPPCERPEDLAATDVTETGATLGWTEIDSATEWEFAILPAGSPEPTEDTPVLTLTEDTYTATDLTSGTCYVFYVRSVCENGEGFSYWSGPFQFCTLISNDECGEATVVPVNDGSQCLETASGTLIGATASAEGNTCFGTDDDDVWFEFEAEAETHNISLINVAGSTTDLYHVVYEGDQCGSLTQLYCSDANSSTASGLTPGTTYKIRVYSWTGLPSQTSTFDVCIRTPVPPIYVSTTDYTVEELVTDVLIGSDCALITNISSSTGSDFGQANGIGYFNENNSGFVFDEGVLLVSGNASQVPGPNTTTMSNNFPGWAGDADLEEAVGLEADITNDATYIQFDFVPLTNVLTFDFLFASEEYDAGSFECTFSDSFAFILTDADGNSENLAVLPGTDIPIQVTNIHPATNSCGAINEEYFSQYYLGDDAQFAPINFNGHTIPMTATATVEPGQQYTIKLVVANERDNGWNSGVFLLANSFDIGTVDLGPDLLVEEGTAICDQTEQLIQTGLDPDDYTFTWFLGDDEIEGATGPDLLVTEPGLYRVVALYNNSTCESTGEVTIEFYPPVEEVTGDPFDLTVCDASGFSTFDFTPNTENIRLGPIDPLNYLVTYHLTEEEAESGDNPIANTTEFVNTVQGGQTIYARIVYDITDCVGVKEFDLIIQDLTPHFGFPEDFSICEGSEGTITVTPEDFDPDSENVTIVWSNNDGPIPGENGTTLTVTEAGDYTVVIDNSGCSATETVTVTETPVPVADEVDDETVCDSYTLQPLSAGNSYFTGTGGTGTQLSAGEVITSTQTIYVLAQSNTTPNCTNESSFEITVVPSPDVTTPGNQTVCDSYTLPQLAVGNYFTSPGGVGAIDAGEAITSTTTLYVYAESGTTPNCTDEESFTITILESPVADAPSDVTVCDLYTLPALSAGNNYFTEPGGQGTMLAAGSPVVYTQTIYVFTSNEFCSDENSFTVTIVPTPMVEAISEGCNDTDYVLEVIFGDDEEFYTADNADFAWSTTPGGNELGTSPSIIVTEIGTYYVRVSPKGSDLGCYVDVSVEVTDTTCTIQKGISPNGDEYNQSFDLSALDVRQLSIFNRYGTEVYSFSGAYTNQWEGQGSGGDELPTGTYFYMIERANGESKTGWVYINREE